MRPLVALLALASSIGAQTPSPIEVTGQISAVDPKVGSGYASGAGLYITVRNLSAKGVSGIVFETRFTDPATGRIAGGRHEHSEYKQPANGVMLAPGAFQESPKPYSLPVTQSGAPAQYSFTVDLVIFDDGSTWGPGLLRSSQRLLAEHPAAK